MVYDFLAVPRKEGKYTVPSVTFVYFDTATNRTRFCAHKRSKSTWLRATEQRKTWKLSPETANRTYVD